MLNGIVMSSKNKTQDKDSIDFEEGIIRAASKQDIDGSVIQDLKKEAMEFISHSSFPNKKDESWKYYDFKDLFSNSSNIFSETANTGVFGAEELDKKDLVKLAIRVD